MEQTPNKTPVDRSRRARFIFRVVAACIGFSAAFVALAGFQLMPGAPNLVELLVDSLLSLATVATVAYVGGSSLDYNGGIKELFWKRDKDGKQPKG